MSDLLSTLRNVPSGEHREALVDFHTRLSIVSGAGATTFGSRFLEDLSKFFDRKFTGEEAAALYVLFLKHSIYMIVCQAIPVFLQVIKDKDTRFIQEFARHLSVVTPDDLPQAELNSRN